MHYYNSQSKYKKEWSNIMICKSFLCCKNKFHIPMHVPQNIIRGNEDDEDDDEDMLVVIHTKHIVIIK